MHNTTTQLLRMSAITESEIRGFIKSQLMATADKTNGRVYEELGLEQGGARVDFALVSDSLHAYELKGDLDKLSRLQNQIHAYNRVFDSITLVTGPLHLQAAMAATPSWWGVVLVSRGAGGGLCSRTVRDATPNPLQQAQSLAALLWKAEATALLEISTGVPVPARLSRAQLYGQLVERLTLPGLKEMVTTSLLHRDYSMLAVNTR
jgi:hypothetical protein